VLGLGQGGLGAAALELEAAQLRLDQPELLVQRTDEPLDGLPLAGQLAVGLVTRAGQRSGRQPFEGGQQDLLVAAREQAAGEQAEGEAEEKPEQEGHGVTVSSGYDRTGAAGRPPRPCRGQGRRGVRPRALQVRGGCEGTASAARARSRPAGERVRRRYRCRA